VQQRFAELRQVLKNKGLVSREDATRSSFRKASRRSVWTRASCSGPHITSDSRTTPARFLSDVFRRGRFGNYDIGSCTSCTVHFVHLAERQRHRGPAFEVAARSSDGSSYAAHQCSRVGGLTDTDTLLWSASPIAAPLKTRYTSTIRN